MNKETVKESDFDGFCKDWYFSIDDEKTLLDNLRQASEQGIASFFTDVDCPVITSVSAVKSEIDGDLKELRVITKIFFENKTIVLQDESLEELILDLVGAWVGGDNWRTEHASCATLLRNIAEMLENRSKP